MKYAISLQYQNGQGLLKVKTFLVQASSSAEALGKAISGLPKLVQAEGFGNIHSWDIVEKFESFSFYSDPLSYLKGPQYSVRKDIVSDTEGGDTKL